MQALLAVLLRVLHALNPATVFHHLIDAFYRRAPFLLGGWEGQDSASICASITTMPASHWFLNMRDCEERIFRKVDSYCVAVLLTVIAIMCMGIIFRIPNALSTIASDSYNRLTAAPAKPALLSPASIAATKAAVTRQANNAKKDLDALTNKNMADASRSFLVYLWSLPFSVTIGEAINNYAAKANLLSACPALTTPSPNSLLLEN